MFYDVLKEKTRLHARIHFSFSKYLLQTLGYDGELFRQYRAVSAGTGDGKMLEDHTHKDA